MSCCTSQLHLRLRSKTDNWKIFFQDLLVESRVPISINYSNSSTSWSRKADPDTSHRNHHVWLLIWFFFFLKLCIRFWSDVKANTFQKFDFFLIKSSESKKSREHPDSFWQIWDKASRWANLFVIDELPLLALTESSEACTTLDVLSYFLTSWIICQWTWTNFASQPLLRHSPQIHVSFISG